MVRRCYPHCDFWLCHRSLFGCRYKLAGIFFLGWALRFGWYNLFRVGSVRKKDWLPVAFTFFISLCASCVHRQSCATIWAHWRANLCIFMRWAELSQHALLFSLPCFPYKNNHLSCCVNTNSVRKKAQRLGFNWKPVSLEIGGLQF